MILKKTNWPWNSPPALLKQDISFPKISIITPSFNQGKYIEETILSVLNQNYPNLEYIIIDGGSTDETLDIIRKYEEHLSYWISEKDKGQSDAINKGLKRVSGEIFNWLNSDDYYAPGTLLKVANVFSDKEVEVFCGQSTIFDEQNCRVSEPSYGFDMDKNNVSFSRINQPATFFRMNVIRELGPLTTNLHYCMDLEWWMKYLFGHGQGKIKYSEEVLVNFREHELSKTIEQSPAFIVDQLKLYSGILAQKDTSVRSIDNYDFNFDLSKVPQDFVFRLTNRLFYYYLVNYYAEGKWSESRKLLNFIKEKQLSDEEKNNYRRIRFRSRFVPVFVFRLLKKFVVPANSKH